MVLRGGSLFQTVCAGVPVVSGSRTGAGTALFQVVQQSFIKGSNSFS